MKKIFIIQVFVCLFLFSCNKQEFLDKKPRTSLLVPTTLDDFEKLLDNYNVINVSANKLGEVSSDDYYLADYKVWAALTVLEDRNAYIWNSDIYEGSEYVRDWNIPYEHILYANIVLEGLKKMRPAKNELVDYNRIKGWAFFIRGHALFNLAQQFMAPYDEEKANDLMGLPIRLESDVTVKSVRSSMRETYDQILADLFEAEILLPNKMPGLDINRPYKIAVNALLARVYLNMHDYEKALKYSDVVLSQYNELIDFSSLSLTAASPIDQYNKEVIYSTTHSNVSSNLIGNYRIAANTLIDSVLYASYDENDLRKSILFILSPTHGKPVIKGSYTGTVNPFTGLATDELYLIKAECEVRIKDFNVGIKVLNDLLAVRWLENYIPYTANSKDAALEIVLMERRKELPFRGLRWQDLRRLNFEGRNISLKRKLDNKEYKLLPNSPLYVLPIPQNEIRINELKQNVR